MERDVFEVLDAIRSPTAVVDSNGEIVFVNRAWREYGRKRGSESDFVGDNYFQTVVSSEQAEKVNSEIQRVFDDDIDAFSIEYPCHGPFEEDWRCVEGAKIDWLDEDYVLLEHIAVNKQKILAREKEQLESFINSHLAYLDHEIRNKFAIVLGQVEELKEVIAVEHPHLVDKHLEPIIMSGNKALTILDNNDPSSPVFQSHSPQEVTIRESIYNVWTRLPTKNASLELNVDGFETILADTVQFEQLFENIFLSVLENVEAEEVCVSVTTTDDGEIIVKHTTGEFADLDIASSTPEQLRMHGIGLELINRIVQNHNWTFDIEKENGHRKAIISNVSSFEEEIDVEDTEIAS